MTVEDNFLRKNFNLVGVFFGVICFMRNDLVFMHYSFIRLHTCLGGFPVCTTMKKKFHLKKKMFWSKRLKKKAQNLFSSIFIAQNQFTCDLNFNAKNENQPIF